MWYKSTFSVFVRVCHSFALPSASFMFTPATTKKGQSISMKTQGVTLSCFKVDGFGYFPDFVHDREVQENKLVTFTILKKYPDSKKETVLM